MSTADEDNILRTKEQFARATMTSIAELNEAHAIWMDHIFGKALEALVDRLALVQELVHAAGDDPEWEKMPIHLHNLVWISQEAVNGTMAAYQIARHGYWQEALVLVRHLLEVAALMLHLCLEPDKVLPAFKAGKWQTTKSIGPAAKLIPGLGRTYGHLNDHTHPLHFFLVGKSTIRNRPEDERMTYSIGGGLFRNNEFFFRHAIRDVLVVGSMLHAVVEFAFRHKVTNFRFWKLEGDKLVWQPAQEEQANMYAFNQLGSEEGNVLPEKVYRGLEKFGAAQLNRQRIVSGAINELLSDDSQGQET